MAARRRWGRVCDAPSPQTDPQGARVPSSRPQSVRARLQPPLWEPATSTPGRSGQEGKGWALGLMALHITEVTVRLSAGNNSVNAIGAPHQYTVPAIQKVTLPGFASAETTRMVTHVAHRIYPRHPAYAHRQAHASKLALMGDPFPPGPPSPSCGGVPRRRRVAALPQRGDPRRERPRARRAGPLPLSVAPGDAHSPSRSTLSPIREPDLPNSVIGAIVGSAIAMLPLSRVRGTTRPEHTMTLLVVSLCTT